MHEPQRLHARMRAERAAPHTYTQVIPQNIMWDEGVVLL